MIAYGDEELRLEVCDDRVMRAGEPSSGAARDRWERIGLYGGRVRVEPLADGPGQRLLARMPLGRSCRMNGFAERLRQIDDRTWDRSLVGLLFTCSWSSRS